MRVTMKSVATGETHTRDIPNLSEFDYAKWLYGGGLIQNILPHLSAEDREFLLTGITPEEWKEVMSASEEGEDEDD